MQKKKEEILRIRIVFLSARFYSANKLWFASLDCVFFNLLKFDSETLILLLSVTYILGEKK